MDFFKELSIKYQIHLTEQQHQAVIQTEGNLLLLACPGSGKTTVMVLRVGYLVHIRKVPPEKILSLTFSKTAAKDMKKRYEHFFGNTHKVSFSTIHSFCYKVMQYHFDSQGVKKENLEGKNSKGWSKNGILSRIYEGICHAKPTEEEIEELSGQISFMKNLGPKDSEDPHIRNHIMPIYEAYEAFKETHHLYDFDDMLKISYETLSTNLEILQFLRNHYRYIHVDEAQDNSRLQNEIIKLLVHDDNNLFMVADDDQTIYEWRGAHPESILNFTKEFPNGKILRMEQNFRSSKNIVSVANAFIKINHNRHDKNILTPNPKYVPIELTRLKDSTDQYDYLIHHLKKGKHLSDYAVLYRSNLSLIPIADRLERENIPFITRGYKGFFFTHFIVSDIKDFIRYGQTGDISYLEKIYYKNDAYISKRIYEFGKSRLHLKKDIFDAMCLGEDLKEYQIHKIRQLKYTFKTLSKTSVKLAIEFIRSNMGYEQWLRNSNGRNRLSVDTMNYMFSILNNIASLCKSQWDFLERLDSLKNSLEGAYTSQKENGVLLSTIHSAKGLEFDHVFMVDLVKGMFPSKEAMDREAEMEAERRLFYVGMTRAKYQLYLLSLYKGYKEEDKASQFYLEAEGKQQELEMSSEA